MTHTLHQQLVELRGQAKTWLARGYAEGFKPAYGICNHLTLTDDDTDLLDALNSAWSGGSGDKDYPVPHPNKNRASAYTNASAQEMWNPKYKYARNRWALLDWLIDQTSDINQLGEKHD